MATKSCGFALLLAVSFIGCQTAREHSLSTAYNETRNLLRSERDDDAWANVERNLRRLNPESAWYWKFRLLRVEILLARREGKQAEAALNFQLPSGPQWSREAARHRFYQGYTAYLLHKDVAGPRLQEAEQLARSSGDSGLMAEIELRQGMVAVAKQEFNEAGDRFRHVIDYATRNHDEYLEMLATGNMGYMLLQSFHFDLAIPWFEKALGYAQALKAVQTQARTVGNLGWCYYRLGDLEKAIHCFEQAEAGFAGAGQRYARQIWLGNIGTIYLDKRDYVRAGGIYQRALTIARDLGDEPSMATWLNNLAMTSIETGDWDSAEHYNDEAWKIKKKLKTAPAEIYSITNAAHIAAGRNDLERAKHLFQSVIESSSEDPKPLLEAHEGLARLREKANDPQASAEFRATDEFIARRSSQLIKDEYKLSYFSQLIEFYQEYVEFFMVRGKPLEALEVAESSRARVLSDRLRLKRDYQPPQTAAGFQKIAKTHGSTLLSYWLAPKASYLWVVTPSSVSSFRLPPEPEIRSLIERYDAFIQNLRDPLKLDIDTGSKLYETLIAPAREILQNSKRIIVTPDGPLFSLNFETLPVGGTRPHYWIEDVALSITPSLRLLSADTEPDDESTGSLLMIGNPVSSDAQYPPLQFAAEEISDIDKSLPSYRKVILTGTQAHAEAYRQSDAGQFGLIHFVAHAVANRQEPLNSAVILSLHGSRDRLLAKDVLDTRLHARLVTISACRSAGAKIYAGEGLVGFSWAFLQAGARNVIAGLWDVADRSTAQTMAQLYLGLARGTAPADALRAAKLDLMHSSEIYHKPYYWGPFQIYIR
jgi:CHAT domain-containing protein/tetratricopeptide (TPR) repeat protein